MHAETHVVTVSLHFIEPHAVMGEWAFCEVHEVFRGDEKECKAICARMSACSHDSRRVQAVKVTCGTIADWEDFLQS
jgi:hypothetical protein